MPEPPDPNNQPPPGPPPLGGTGERPRLNPAPAGLPVPVSQPYQQQQQTNYPPPGGQNGPPGMLKVCAILHIIAGALDLVYALGFGIYFLIVGIATFGIGCIFCIFPLIFFPLGLMSILHGSGMLNNVNKPPSDGLAIVSICSVLQCNFISCVLGILILVFANSDEVKAWKHRY